MAEPTATTTVTIAAASVAVPALTAFGVPLGLRADVLVAGFAGALVAIVLLDSVPASGDTWRHLIRTTLRRMFVALSSSLTAGYLTPMVALLAGLTDPYMLGVSFAVGGGAQRVLLSAIRRISPEPSAALPRGDQ